MSSRCVVGTAIAATALVGALVCACPAAAQTQVACNITEVKVEQLSNAVEVTLKADGLLNVEVDIFQFVERDEEGHWDRTPGREIPIQITNARSQIGTFVDIGTYPVSHLELTTPAEAREGVGLDVRLMLYEPAIIHALNVDNWDNFDWDVPWGTMAFDVRKSQSGRELQILVWSDRHEEVIAPPTPRHEQKLPSQLSVDYVDGRLTVDCVNVPLEQLAAEVAAAAGTTIYVDDRVRRLATVQMRNVPVDRFVTAMAAGYGLSVTRMNGMWMVSDGLPTSLAPYTAGGQRRYHLRYIEAREAIRLLPNFLLRYLKPSDSGDSIVAYGPPPLLDRIGEDLAAIDRPAQLIRVRTAVVEASDSDTSQLIWRLVAGSDPRLEIDGAEGTIGIQTGEGTLDQYLAHIRALDTSGSLRVRTRPSLVVTAGRHASIFIGQRQYYQYLESGADTLLRSAQAGVRLSITPRPRGSDLIQVRVRLTVSTFRRVTSGAPILDTREARTTMNVTSGDTLVLGGGLYLEDEARERRGPRPFREMWGLSHPIGSASDDSQLREIIFLVSAEYVRSRPHEADTEEPI